MDHQGGNGGVPRDNGGVSARKRAGKEGKKEKIFIGEEHGGITSSMKKDQGVDLHRHGIEEIFYIIREVAPKFSASTEPGGRISCYFEFSSLQSRVISV